MRPSREEKRHARERTPFAPTDCQLAGLDDGLRGAGADHDRLVLAEMMHEGSPLRAQACGSLVRPLELVHDWSQSEVYRPLLCWPAHGSRPYPHRTVSGLARLRASRHLLGGGRVRYGRPRCRAARSAPHSRPWPRCPTRPCAGHARSTPARPRVLGCYRNPPGRHGGKTRGVIGALTDYGVARASRSRNEPVCNDSRDPGAEHPELPHDPDLTQGPSEPGAGVITSSRRASPMRRRVATAD
jgi:hypothetical protein